MEWAVLAHHVIDGRADEVARLTRQALDEGVGPREILEQGLIAGMHVIGVRFRANEIFLPEVLVEAAAAEVAEPEGAGATEAEIDRVDIVGQRRLFLTGFIVFIAGSLLSSLTQNVPSLIATRIVQAIGGGMITSASAPLITRRLPGTHRGRGLSAQIVMVYFGLAAGPGLGLLPEAVRDRRDLPGQEVLQPDEREEEVGPDQ